MKFNKIKKIILLVLLATLTIEGGLFQTVRAEAFTMIDVDSTSISDENVFDSRIFTFNKGKEGWKGGFADLPVDYNPDIYNLDFKHTNIPIEGAEDKGLMLKGSNRSDDLFMYITRKFDKKDGLRPNTKYKMILKFKLATNAASEGMGVGGAPGESVFVKTGIVNRKPVVENIDGQRTMNIDKGNQINSGKDMQVIGNIAKAESSDNTYEYKNFENEFEVVTNENGEVWVIIGTDSGYEGITEIYITDIKLTVSK